MKVLCSVKKQQKTTSCMGETMALLKGKALPSGKTLGSELQFQRFSRHQRSTKDVDCYIGYRRMSKSIERNLCATRLGSTRRYNEGETSTIRCSYTTGSRKIDAPGRTLEANNDRSELPDYDQFGRWHDLRDGIYQWRH